VFTFTLAYVVLSVAVSAVTKTLVRELKKKQPMERGATAGELDVYIFMKRLVFTCRIHTITGKVYVPMVG